MNNIQEKTKFNFIKIFLFLIKESKPNKLLFFLLFIAFLLIPLSITSLGIFIKNFIDKAFILSNSGSYNSDIIYNNLNKYTLYFIGTILVLGFASSIRVFVVNYLNDFIISKIKEKIFEKILDLDIKTFDSYGKNFFKTLLGFDIEEVITSINLKLSLIARNIGLFFGSIILLLSNNFRLSAIIIIAIIFVLFFISIMGIKLRKSIKNLKLMKNDIFLYLDESISFIKLIKISNFSKNQVGYLEKNNEKIIKNAFILYIFRGFFIGFIIISLLLTIVLTIYLGSIMIINNSLTPGLLSSFIFYALLASTSLGGIIESFFEISKYKLNLEKIYNVLSINLKIDSIASMRISHFEKIEFKSVSFSYDLYSKVINDISFEINRGEKIAIIGPSGSGKTTILNLILGFFVIESGSIILNDKYHINDLNKESYYDLIAFLSQEVEIFSSTIYDNMTYGAKNVDQELLNNLIDRFNLREFIENQKDKIHTRIGDMNGLKLSGGQKQRIGIIRALLKKPHILVLDESTASLDSENESEIYNLLLSDQNKDLTIIFVTHRLSFLDSMNKVIRINNNGCLE